ncbi:hypothetical protein Tco_0937679 [Tanacetum coccineum]|uniref:Uncharacterized protein n=1 Tax=Tanacetum coccineum TaxID=301880 RepID=A0ABQ5DL46_9ASTR
MEILPVSTSNSTVVILLKLNLPDHRYRRWNNDLIPAASDSLPRAHSQATKTTKTYYKHQDSRIKNA